ncbi:MAG: XdhC family protein, partial [Bacteroidota bacterium]
MKEIKDILKTYDAIDKGTINLALATVIDVKGSSYRRTGARMLIQDDGTWTGGISGGCIEGDALKKAHLAMTSRKPVITTYDTSNKAEEQIGVSLGCNGVIQVLISHVDTNDSHNPIECLRPLTSTRKEVMVITVIDSNISGILAGNVYTDGQNEFPYEKVSPEIANKIKQTV